MEFIPTEIPEVLIIEPDIHRDARGFFFEFYRRSVFAENGIPCRFIQDNLSSSVKNTLRGLHAQYTLPQAKLVRVVRGEILDVAVDIRRGSPTFGKWIGIRLCEDNHRALFIPRGFLHGFWVLSDTADVEYKCDNYYDPEGQITVRWDDPDIGICWPAAPPLLSDKDRCAPRLEELDHLLPAYD